MKILSIVGARPQFIKLAPLSKEIRKGHEEIILHTGQHYDREMSDLFFEQLQIAPPDINLEIGSGMHGQQTGKMLAGIEQAILNEKPDLVLSFGDTNSTLAACLAASKLEVPSLHIEAGLRSFNRSMPEEINRIVADHTADLLFAPTEDAVNHLKSEGLESRTVLTGDIMVDSVNMVHEKTARNESIEEYLLMTLHRPYNVDNPKNLKRLIEKLSTIKQKILFAAHPRTKKVIEVNDISIPEMIEIIPSQGYIEFQTLLKNCQKVITDSGGLQKEAYIAGKPCITLRPETEWVETIEAGWNILLDINDLEFTNKIKDFEPSGKRPKFYGKHVAFNMVEAINEFMNYR